MYFKTNEWLFFFRTSRLCKKNWAPNINQLDSVKRNRPNHIKRHQSNIYLYLHWDSSNQRNIRSEIFITRSIENALQILRSKINVVGVPSIQVYRFPGGSLITKTICFVNKIKDIRRGVLQGSFPHDSLIDRCLVQQNSKSFDNVFWVFSLKFLNRFWNTDIKSIAITFKKRWHVSALWTRKLRNIQINNNCNNQKKLDKIRRYHLRCHELFVSWLVKLV